MSKIGVGIGEDFPLDDHDGGREDGRTRPDDNDGAAAAYADHREAHRRWREQRREWKRRWRDEWRDRRRAFRDDFRGSYYGDGHPRMMWGHPVFWGGHGLWRILAVVAVIALGVFLFSHIYLILGVLVLMALVAAAFRHGFDPFDLPPHRYGRDGRRDDAPRGPTPPPPAPPAQTTRDDAQ